MSRIIPVHYSTPGEANSFTIPGIRMPQPPPTSHIDVVPPQDTKEAQAGGQPRPRDCSSGQQEVGAPPNPYRSLLSGSLNTAAWASTSWTGLAPDWVKSQKSHSVPAMEGHRTLGLVSSCAERNNI